ncbi:MAG: hypothetical protein NUV75_01780 [Gallionella sp.]|nr:hypothetical protein [Gallionella sp.]
MEQDELPLFPVTEYEVRAIPAYGALFIRFGFLSHSMQGIEEADPGRRYVFHPAQAREVRDAIDRALHALENAGPQDAPGERH